MGLRDVELVKAIDTVISNARTWGASGLKHFEWGALILNHPLKVEVTLYSQQWWKSNCEAPLPHLLNT